MPQASSSAVSSGSWPSTCSAVGIDPHEQVAGVEAGLEPHRQQREREVGGDQSREVVRVLARDQLGAQALELCGGRGGLRRRRGGGDLRRRGRDRALCGDHQRVPRLPRGGDLRALRGDVRAQRGGQRLDRGLPAARVRELGVGRGELRRHCRRAPPAPPAVRRWPRPAGAACPLAAVRAACACVRLGIAARSASKTRFCAAFRRPAGGCPPSSCMMSARSWRASATA